MAETRDVPYKLKLIAHEDNERQVKSFESKAMDAQKKVAETAEKSAETRKRSDNRLTQSQIANATRAANVKMSLIRAVEKEQRRANEANRRSSEQALAKLQDDHAKATERITAGNAQMIEGFTSGTESVMRFARGITLLGLASEKDLKKVLQTLVKVQAFFDIVVGGINTMMRLTKAVEGWRMVTTAASQAEHINKLKSIALTKAQTKAELELAAAKVLSSGAGGGKGAGAKQSLIGSASRFIGGAPAAAAGGGITRLLGGLLKLSGVATLVVGAFAGLAAFISKDFREGLMNFLGFSTKAQKENKKRTEAAERRRAEFLAVRARRERMIEAESSGFRSRQQLQDFNTSALDLADSGDVEGRRESNRNRIRDLLRDRQANLRAVIDPQLEARRDQIRRRPGSSRSRAERELLRRTPGERAELNRREVDFSEKLIRAAKNRLSIEREISAEKTKTARDAIKAAERELQVIKQAQDRERDRLKTAAERFGQLDRFDQLKLIGIKRKADAGGNLTAFEREQLRAVGTRDTEEIASRGDLASARRGGFFDTFGRSEARNVRQLAAQAAAAKVTINDQRNLIVKIEAEDDKLVKSTAAFIVKELDRRTQLLERKIRQDVERQRVEASQASQQQLAGRRAAIGR